MKFIIPFIYFIHFYYYYLGDVGAATPYSLGFLFQVEHTSQEFSLRFQLRIALEAKGKFVQVSGMGINRGYHLTNNGKRFFGKFIRRFHFDRFTGNHVSQNQPHDDIVRHPIQ